MRNDELGLPILTYGFRVFFLAAGVYAVAVLAAWLTWLGLHLAGAVVTGPSFSGAPHLWHGHEMIFGYAIAAVAGFMLTAIPSWTGARPVTGTPLAVLGLVWLAGRVVIWLSALLPGAVVAAVDLAFLPLFAYFVTRGLLLKPAPRNLVFLVFLALLFVSNLAVHLEWNGITGDSALWGLYCAILTLALMVSIIGGRIVPAFTRNVLVREGQTLLPRSFPAVDAIALGAGTLTVLGYVFGAPAQLAGAVAALAAAAHLVRLSFWRFQATLGSPILWSLHLAYLWLVIGYGLLAAALLTGALGEALAMHAIGIGAVGGMTLAVMTRAALGHSCRPLVTARAITWSYVLVALAAVARTFGPVVLPGYYLEIVLGAGAFWVAGFAIFVVVYWPILTGPSKTAD